MIRPIMSVMRELRPVTIVPPEKAPSEPVMARAPVWCPQTLWDEGVYPCLRPAHPPGTHHWYDMRKASQPAKECSA